MKVQAGNFGGTSRSSCSRWQLMGRATEEDGRNDRKGFESRCGEEKEEEVGEKEDEEYESEYESTVKTRTRLVVDQETRRLSESGRREGLSFGWGAEE